jgi:hypothetical protein
MFPAVFRLCGRFVKPLNCDRSFQTVNSLEWRFGCAVCTKWGIASAKLAVSGDQTSTQPGGLHKSKTEPPTGRAMVVDQRSLE